MPKKSTVRPNRAANGANREPLYKRVERFIEAETGRPLLEHDTEAEAEAEAERAPEPEPEPLHERLAYILEDIGTARAVLRITLLAAAGELKSVQPGPQRNALIEIRDALRVAIWKLDEGHNDLDVEREQLAAQAGHYSAGLRVAGGSTAP